jgi:iron complex outermembrane recepter protein
MNLNSNELAKAVRLALTFGVVSAAGAVATTAYAQDAKTGDKAESLETITVIGSRIKRADVETSQPVFVLERADLQRTGLTSIGDVLQQLSTNGASLNTQINNGNQNGAQQVDLRNCGANRTLVLVNSRRWVTDLSGIVDLTTIPFAIVERVEVLKDGASSVYGTDAICGVINITTRDNYDGAEASGYIGQTSESDGRKEAYEFTIGSSSERANVVMNVSYVKQEAIFAGDRDISAVPLFGFPGGVSAPGQASGTTPFGRFRVNGVRLTLDPSKPGCRPGVQCATTSAADFRPAIITDGFNFAPTNYIQQPQETKSLYTQARYNITDNIRFKTEVLYSDRTSATQLAAQPLNPFDVSGASLYNPFRVNIVGASFRPTSLPRRFNADSQTWRFAGGFDGNFDLLDRNWSWDLSYTFSENKLAINKTGFFNANAFGLATGPSFIDVTGVPTCGTVAAPIDGCVPFNVFGGPTGFTQEQANGVLVTPHDITEDKLTIYQANITGDLFQLPAGPLGFAAGYEYRREFGFNEPDALTQSGAVLGDNPAAATSGGFSLDEFYAELSIPILKDVPFANILEFSLADRYSDYSNFGHTSNPKFGFRWKPIDDLLVRGNYAKGFRAPSVNELFLGANTNFPELVDPCSASNLGPANNPSLTAACRAAGVPVGYEQANTQIGTTFGGNPALTPERATTKTLGLVYSPNYLQGLDVYLDWYNIKIKNSIGTILPQTLLDTCYNGTNVGNCRFITRDVGGTIFGNPGEISSLLANNQNFTTGLEVEGYDLTVNYKFDTEFGKFRINWDNAYTSYYGALGQPKTDLTTGTTGNQIGQEIAGGTTLGRWRLRSNIGTNWSFGDFEATLNAEYFSALKEDCSQATATADALNGIGITTANPCSDPNEVNVLGPAPRNTLGDIWYFDLQGAWHAPWNGTITAGIRNLFDKDPPKCFSCFANTFDASYRSPGRFYYVQYQQKF